MSSTNKGLRDGIKSVAEALVAHEHNKTVPNLGHYACELYRLLHETLDSSPADTARLDWFLEHHTGTLSGLGVTRATIDAAMRPAPKFRPWTQGESHGKDVVWLDTRYTLTTTCPNGAWIKDGYKTWVWILANGVQPDGTPCGVEVRE